MFLSGRGGMKTTAAATAFVRIALEVDGARLMGVREVMKSIDQSSHAAVLRAIRQLGVGSLRHQAVQVHL